MAANVGRLRDGAWELRFSDEETAGYAEALMEQHEAKARAHVCEVRGFRVYALSQDLTLTHVCEVRVCLQRRLWQAAWELRGRSKCGQGFHD